jgi:hypothetical protein
MTKKKVIATILSNICKWVPILVYGCFNIESFYSTSEKGITISAIILIGAVLCYFKDAFKTWIKSPSAFKYVAILWVISLIFVVLGDQMFIITSILLASFLVAVPFDAWRKSLNENAVDDETITKLKEFLSKK